MEKIYYLINLIKVLNAFSGKEQTEQNDGNERTTEDCFDYYYYF